MRIPAIALCLAVGIGGATDAAAAETDALADKLTQTIKACIERKDPKACENELFAFADATKDGKLSKAEMTRMLRWLAAAGQNYAKQELGDQKMPPDAAKHLAALQVYASFIGPFLADGIIHNFDYDGDGLVAKTEIYLDHKEGELDKALMAMVETGQDLAKNAMSMASKGGLPALGDKAMGMKLGGAKKKPPGGMAETPQTAEVPGAGLEIRGVQPTRSGGNTLQVSGTIANISAARVRVPNVRVALLGGAGNEIQGVDAPPARIRLSPGETTTFIAIIDNPSAQARNVKVRFAN